MSDLFLLQRSKGAHGGFDIWALERTHFNVDHCVSQIADRLRPFGSVHSQLREFAEETK